MEAYHFDRLNPKRQEFQQMRIEHMKLTNLSLAILDIMSLCIIQINFIVITQGTIQTLGNNNV